MAQVDVELDKSKLDLVWGIKERIGQLFGVLVDLKTSPGGTTADKDVLGCGNRDTSFTLCLSATDSQESLEKAKIFLKAILEEGPEFTTELCPLSPDQLEMVRKNSQAIERQSLSVLDFDLAASQLRLKGHNLNVEAARRQVSMLIMGQGDANVFSPSHKQLAEKKTNSGQHEPVQSSGSFGFSVGQGISSSAGHSNSSVDHIDKMDVYTTQMLNQNNNNVMDSSSRPDTMRSYSLVTDGTDFSLPSLTEGDLVPRGAQSRGSVSSLERTFANAVSFGGYENSRDFSAGDSGDKNRTKEAVSEQSSSNSISSDDSSGVGLMDKADPRYEQWLEFALKLGYNESDLDKVIRRHGLEIDGNRMLQELIECSLGSSDQDIETAEILSPGVVSADITSSEVFLGVMKKVKSEDKGSNLRHIVIDGSNVAMSHGKNAFSCRGIKIAVDWFKDRGHKEITVFVPQWRKETSRPDTPISDQHLLLELEKEGIVVFTPARRIKGRRVVCYDDRFVLKLAAETNGIVVSNDNYRDLLNENQEFRKVVDERLLMYTFVNDRFMPPDDPLGRRGPTLDNFLSKEPTTPQALPPDCPYGRKCTYGNKCKYHHPERGSQPHRTVTEVLKEQASLKMQERAVRSEQAPKRGGKQKLTRTRSLVPGEPLPGDKTSADGDRVKSPSRSVSSSKTSDYLRDARKILELATAVASAQAESTDSGSAATSLAGVPSSSAGFSAEFTSPPSKPVESLLTSRAPEALSPLPLTGSRVSSPAHLNVPPFSNPPPEGLVSGCGHLLLAKKLSDEASESSFFSNESSSNRASPVSLTSPVARPDSTPMRADKVFDRRQSLQDQAFLQQNQRYLQQVRDTDSGAGTGSRLSGPARYPSQPAMSPFDIAMMTAPPFGAQCQSYPFSEKESGHSTLRRVTSYTEHPSSLSSSSAIWGVETSGQHREHLQVKPQQSCPPSQFGQGHSGFPGQTLTTKVVRQNSTSDPQLHIASSDNFTHPWLPSLPPTPAATTSYPGLDPRGGRALYSGEYRGEVGQPQGLFRSTSVQQPALQQGYAPHSLDRQFSEGVYSPVDFSAHPQQFVAQQQQQGWGPREMYLHSHLPPHHSPTTPSQPAQSPIQHQQPHPHFSMSPHQQQQASAWSPVPVSPVRTMQPAAQPQRSFPPQQPIPPNDPRYSMYYHLCSIFAEHRVRAVMNKYPDEKDPKNLSAHIISM